MAISNGMAVTISTPETSITTPGRRTFVKYRELGVTEATHGKMRAQVMSCDPGSQQPTGWHFHVCDMQFLYLTSGWLELEIEGKGLVRFNKGDSVLLPGGTVHQEVNYSDDMQLVEISVPADMGTQRVDPPPGALDLAAKR
jgi:quercetin dioxygenase-like cupin family protein